MLDSVHLISTCLMNILSMILSMLREIYAGCTCLSEPYVMVYMGDGALILVCLAHVIPIVLGVLLAKSVTHIRSLWYPAVPFGYLRWSVSQMPKSASASQWNLWMRGFAKASVGSVILIVQCAFVAKCVSPIVTQAFW